jgi:putative protease
MLDINDQWLTIDVKNRFFAGDLMELVMPSGNITFDLPEIRNKDDQAVDVAPGSGHVVRIPIPDGTDVSAIDEFAMLVRYLPRDSVETA